MGYLNNNDFVRNLAGYAQLKKAADSFENDKSQDNIEARTLITNPYGRPSYGDSAGVVAVQLENLRATNLGKLDSIVTKDTYKKVRDEVFTGMDEGKTLAAYAGLLIEYGDLRGSLQRKAFMKFAASNRLEQKLSEKDSSFHAKSDDDKFKAYVKAISTTKELGEKLNEDPLYKLVMTAEILSNAREMLQKKDIAGAADYISKSLGAHLAALYSDQGSKENAKKVVEDTLVAQQALLGGLLKTQPSLKDDVEKSLGEIPSGYSKAIGEFFDSKGSR